DEIVAGLVAPRKNLAVVAEQVWRPLVSFAAHEPVEIIKAHAARPLVERTLHADLIARRVVIFSKPRGGITVGPQNIPDGGVVWPDDGVVAGITGGLFSNHPKTNRVMVAPGNQRRARRRAERGRMHLRVAQSHAGDP